MKKLVVLASVLFSVASFASLTPMNLILHQNILQDTQAVVNGVGSPIGHAGFNSFPWSGVTGLCSNNNNCVATVFVIDNNGNRIKAGKIKADPSTGLMSVLSSNNGYQITVNGIADVSIQKVS